MVQSVRPSVCLSIHVSVTPLSLCSHSHIMQFSGVITNGKSDVSSKGQGQRSSPQRSKLNLAVFGLKFQFLFIDGYEIMLKLEVAYKRCPNVFQCQCQISRSHETKNANFDQKLAFADCNSSLNSPMVTK